MFPVNYVYNLFPNVQRKEVSLFYFPLCIYFASKLIGLLTKPSQMFLSRIHCHSLLQDPREMSQSVWQEVIWPSAHPPGPGHLKTWNPVHSGDAAGAEWLKHPGWGWQMGFIWMWVFKIWSGMESTACLPSMEETFPEKESPASCKKVAHVLQRCFILHVGDNCYSLIICEGPLLVSALISLFDPYNLMGWTTTYNFHHFGGWGK